MTKKNYMQETRHVYRTALKAARKAGGYLLARFRRDDRIVKSNEKHDVKLDVDVETENLIINTIRRVFPGHGFLGEEGGGLPGGDGVTREAAGTWIIDPLDGTVNFAWGIPHFCTSIAFKRGDVLAAGAVFSRSLLA